MRKIFWSIEENSKIAAHNELLII